MELGCAVCRNESADIAWERQRSFVPVARLVDETHFGVSLVRCGGCGQTFASVFCETIDWTGGNDPQDWLIIPVTAPEADARVAAGHDGVERILSALAPERRYLVRWFPSDADKPDARWVRGRVSLPRHD